MSLIDVLLRASAQWASGGDLERLNQELKTAFLTAYSASDDNLETARYFEIGQVEQMHGPSPVQGLVLSGRNELVSNLLWTAFGETDIPGAVREACPELTLTEWNQVIRIAQIAVSLFERGEA